MNSPFENTPSSLAALRAQVDAQAACLAALREFVADIDAIGGVDACYTLDWPDLSITYRKAVAALEALDRGAAL